MAIEMSKMSHCQSKQVACLFVNVDGRIVSTGINGTPRNYTNCSDVFPNGVSPENRKEHQKWSDIHELHAEQNAITVAAKAGVSVEGTTAFCTLKPCGQCVKLLIAAGISRVVYAFTYDRFANEEITHIMDSFIVANGIIIHHLDMTDE